MHETIIIDQQFCGPPNMANGGYVAGLLAKKLTGPVKVTLRRPIPLERPLTAETIPDHLVILRQGEMLLAEAQPTRLEIELPSVPYYTDAAAVTGQHPNLDRHPFPHCFVCGPNRQPADGLRILPGPLRDDELVAAVWRPDDSLADDSGHVAPEFLWAALDCPGGTAAVHRNPRPIVLGQLRVHIQTPVKPGSPCIVLGWRMGGEGRKHLAGSALFSILGQPIAYGQAIWLEVTPDYNGHDRLQLNKLVS